jgi:hypothetical protein
LTSLKLTHRSTNDTQENITIMLAQFKPYLTALIMPPASLLMLVALGWFMLHSKKYQAWGKRLIALGVLSLVLLSSNKVAFWLNETLLPAYPMTSANEVLKFNAGAIVVLGGGVETDLPDGVPQLQTPSLDRLRYGVYLHRKTGVPLLFTGGKGWGASNNFESEADVTLRVAKEVFGVDVKWLESQSRDTQENAENTFKILHSEGISKITLVTHSWHMPRGVQQFETAGFEVLPAPMGQMSTSNAEALQWIPSTQGLKNSQTVLREKLALLVMSLKP